MSEANAVKISEYLADVAADGSVDSSAFEAVSIPSVKIEISSDGGKTWIDVDSTWDGKVSLDEHRQQEFAKITQPGFGDAGKVKTDGE